MQHGRKWNRQSVPLLVAGRGTFPYLLSFLHPMIPAKNRVGQPGLANAARCATEKAPSQATLPPLPNFLVHFCALPIFRQASALRQFPILRTASKLLCQKEENYGLLFAMKIACGTLSATKQLKNLTG